MPWRTWLAHNFPAVCTAPFADRHVRLWDWFDALTPGEQSRPRVEVWPRGGGKSSTAELGVARLSAKMTRKFALYVSETQKQANERVGEIQKLFETLGVQRAVNQYGISRGWTGSLLRTASGFNVLALGLDAAGRGVKFDQNRPDIMIFDDVDGRHDTEDTRNKKIQTITTSLIPAGSPDCAVLFLQNLIYADSIVSQLVDGRADFLHDRTVSEVYVAVENLEVEQRTEPDGTLRFYITGGKPTWEWQNLEACETQLNRMGLRAFLREAQQEVDEEEGGLWTRAHFDATRVTSHPDLARICVAIDPNISENGDDAGIVVGGNALVGGVMHGFVLEDATISGGPKKWAEAAVAAYNRHEADIIVAEVNNGGDMVALTIGTVTNAPKVKLLHASRGKITRAEPVQKLWEDGRAHNVGHFALMEKECCVYRPGMPSPNRMDALVWCMTELMLNASYISPMVGGQRDPLIGYASSPTPALPGMPGQGGYNPYQRR